MSTLQYVAAAAAVCVALWPQIVAGVEWLVGYLFSDDHDHTPAPLAGPSYQAAIASLASVRLRLKSTDCLDEERKKAIDVLTLGLVDGSDK